MYMVPNQNLNSEQKTFCIFFFYQSVIFTCLWSSLTPQLMALICNLKRTEIEKMDLVQYVDIRNTVAQTVCRLLYFVHPFQ